MAKRKQQKAIKKTNIGSLQDPENTIVRHHYNSSLRLQNKVAIITGGDSGIGQSVAVRFALEGANVAIVYLKSYEDARETKTMIENANQSCLLFKGDVRREA